MSKQERSIHWEWEPAKDDRSAMNLWSIKNRKLRTAVAWAFAALYGIAIVVICIIALPIIAAIGAIKEVSEAYREAFGEIAKDTTFWSHLRASLLGRDCP